MEKLKAFKSGDGAHCGLTDWYPEKEAALAEALASGKPFDTGWYGSKKEIASARIWSDDGKMVRVEASVSDDFDTHGLGEAVAEASTLDAVAAAVMQAWEEAEGDQKDNRQYVGYSLFHWTTKIPDWCRLPTVFPRETLKRYGRKRAQCLDYLILPAIGCEEMDAPPGDYFFYWGWQNHYVEGDDAASGKQCVEEGIPAKTVKAFEEFARAGQPGSLRIGDWEIRAWSDN